MAAREASLRVTIKNQGALAGLRQMQSTASRVGARMGAALSGPMNAGLAKAKATMNGMMGQMGGHMKTAATLGGAFAMGKFVKDAIDAQHTYRNLAAQVNRASGNSEDWRSVLESIEPIANKTGQVTSEMAESFAKIFGATGNLQYTKQSMEAIGNAATATGIDVKTLADAMQMANRKFGVGFEQSEAAITAFIEKIGIGGVGADDLNSKFAMMAGEASEAGMSGVQGISTLLGMMLKLDSAVGEKAAPGLKMMFQTLKENTTQIKALEKAAGFKFEPDTTALDKIRKTLGSEKGRVAAQLTFTADSRVVYDTLSQPFEQAYKDALKNGSNVQEATEIGLAAYDKSVGEMTESNMKYSDLQKQAADRMKDDPTVIMRTAINKMASAFSDERMMDAIERLAKGLPGFADGFVKLLDFVIKHPLLSAGGFVGAKLALSFAGGALVKAGAGIGASFLATAKGGLVLAGTAAGVAMQVALVAGLAAAAAGIGYAIATAIADHNNETLEESHTVRMKAMDAEHSKDPIQMKKALTEVRNRIARNKEDKESLLGMASTAMYKTKEFFGGDKYFDVAESENSTLAHQERRLVEALKKQKEGADKSGTSAKKAAQNLDELGESVGRLNEVLKRTGGGSGGSAPGKGGPPGPLHTGPGYAM